MSDGEKGAAAIVATQDWEQILKLYQQHDAATLEVRFKVKVVCRLGISETRDRVVSKYAGRRTIETWVVVKKDKSEKTRHKSEIDVIEPNWPNSASGRSNSLHWLDLSVDFAIVLVLRPRLRRLVKKSEREIRYALEHGEQPPLHHTPDDLRLSI